MNDEFQLLIDSTLSPAAQSNAIAQFALDTLNSNGNPDYKKYVDGVEGADEHSVKPSGSIVYEFDTITDVLSFIGKTLEMNSPTGNDKHSGLYKASHRLLADDVEIPIDGAKPTGRVFTFVSMLPYSGKIERGESSQAPSGVYELTAQQARTRFGGSIEFIDYVDTSTGSEGKKMHNVAGRFPAIQVTV